MRQIIIENAKENNLKDVSLKIPHYKLIVVTGVSGSGKTSLVYDVLCAEGKRLFFENFIGGRLGQVKLSRPDASKIEGLFPVISIDQDNTVRNPRSTVGTQTEIYDYLRLLFARLGKTDIQGLKLNRSLFSFNHPDGWCPVCKGIGLEDHIDPELIIGDASKTIREGVFVLTTPNNYIVYSQVTMDVLDQVCRSEGFNVDIPWKDLTEYQKNVVLNGSKKIKVLFGKHTLESRLKWTGITAKPREEDYYKGIIPVMEEILRRERNPNIMRFTRSYTCSACAGKRLNNNALSAYFHGLDIASFSQMAITAISDFFSKLEIQGNEKEIYEPVREAILDRCSVLIKLHNGHLSVGRLSSSISSGESQRIKIANHATTGLRNVLYIIDEPSAGLHPSEHADLLDMMRQITDNGNTVILVDHDEQTILKADWIIDIGPGAGQKGGEIIFNGPLEEFLKNPVPESITAKFLLSAVREIQVQEKQKDYTSFNIPGACRHNLRNISPSFIVGGLNVITGITGSGKTSLVDHLTGITLKEKSGGTDIFRKVIHIDPAPIGRSPKSNPATYTGVSDHIRDLFASLDESKTKGFKKGQFSFVVKGGRCESCGGAGVKQIGMYFLDNIEVICEDCGGKRFSEETLSVKYKGLSIFDVLELTVDEADSFFEGNRKITAITSILSELGLGYLKLGQPSTTLSGGEAQRVKLATELARPATGNTLYILDEPTGGLHMADIEILLKALKKLTSKGHTLLCVEHDPAFILCAEHMVDLGPGSSENGGNIVFEGSISEALSHGTSATCDELRHYTTRKKNQVWDASINTMQTPLPDSIFLANAGTNNLKNINVAFPSDKITAVTGVSGSGKSSLVYGTLFAESNKRFLEGLSTRVRQYAFKAGIPVLGSATGLMPAVAVRKKNLSDNPRSTLATYTGLYDLYRLLFSRLGKSDNGESNVISSLFSFNHDEGACPVCKGLGTITVCDENKLVTHPHLPLINGALDGSKTGKFYGDPHGQYVAALLTAGEKYSCDLSLPYDQLDTRALKLAMHGCGDEIFNVKWHYKRGTRKGVHELKTTWPGFLKLVETEYVRKHTDYRGESMLNLMSVLKCTSCNGYRLNAKALGFRIAGINIGELNNLSAEESLDWFNNDFRQSLNNEVELKIAGLFMHPIPERLESLIKTGLGYISTGRITSSLSGGEYQRLQLAGLVNAPMSGVAYILDEPSFGLHPVDIEKISHVIQGLNDNGNTVIMVENSEKLISLADKVIELGPGSGDDGGKIIFEGNQNTYPIHATDEKIISNIKGYPGLQIFRANANNLKDIDVEFLSGALNVITGVSGSGKTSLLENVIHESSVNRRIMNCEAINGLEKYDEIIYIEQPSQGSGRDITTGKYLGINESVAKIFAETAKAKESRFGVSHFIPGSKESRCVSCEGTGELRVSMDYFSDVISVCEKCSGTGFNDLVNDIQINGMKIYEVLQLPFPRLKSFIDCTENLKVKNILTRMLDLLSKTGLNHLDCGRKLKTLSTGEIQRLKLASGIFSTKGNNTLFLLDEPTGGLHAGDVGKLLHLFHGLLLSGNTLICVSHDKTIINNATRVIQLGPGGGNKGGEVVDQGVIT